MAFASALQRVGRRLHKRLVFFVVIAVASLLLVFLAWQFSNRIESMRSAPQDNAQWAMAQIDVELLALALAVRDAKEDEPQKLREIRKRFDIFYGRVATLRALPKFAEGPSQHAISDKLSTLQQELDALSDIINSSDPTLFAELPQISASLDALRPHVREISLDGVRYYSTQSDEARDELVNLFRLTAITDLVLIGLLISSVFLIARQFWIVRDSTAALQDVSERNASTINASFDPIIVTDYQGKIVEFNPAATKIFGVSRNAAIGSDMADLIVPPRLRKAHSDGMHRFRSTGERKVIGTGPVTMPALRSDGTEFMAELSITTSESRNGNHLIAFLRDISNRVEQEVALRKARDDALETARLKSQFLAVMSHEMRTPLNGVMAVLDLLGETRLTAQQANFVRTAMTSAEVLKQHVDDVLDLTRIQAGKLELETRTFDLQELLEEICRLNEAVAAARGNRILLAANITEPYIRGDRKKLHQILTNLVSNAIKFTSDGSITIASTFVAVSADVVTAELSVSDTGIGIPPDLKEKIFEEFYTRESVSQGSASGAGLGLPICRSFVEAMGGVIGVESAVSEGSRFWFRVPLHAVHAEGSLIKSDTDSTKAAKGPQKLHVLLVEDNATNRFVVVEMLKRLNCSVEEAINGKEGVDRAAKEQFDLILMDLSMPVMNGWEATRALRSNHNGKSWRTPIYALSAHVIADEDTALEQGGFQGYVFKPLRLKVLEGVLEGVRSVKATHRQSANRQEKLDSIQQVDRRCIADLVDLIGAPALRDRVTECVAELEDGLQKLRNMSGRADAGSRAALSHKLAGSAAVYGAANVRDLLLSLESHCKTMTGKKLAGHIEKIQKSIESYQADLNDCIGEADFLIE